MRTNIIITRFKNGASKMMQEITVSKKVKSRNVLDQMHWSARNRDKKEWEQVIYYEGLKGKKQKNTTHRVAVTILSYRKARIRDDANFRGGCKGLIDALKRLELIVDDDDRWIEDNYIQIVVPTPSLERTVIRLTQMEGE